MISFQINPDGLGWLALWQTSAARVIAMPKRVTIHIIARIVTPTNTKAVPQASQAQLPIARRM